MGARRSAVVLVLLLAWMTPARTSAGAYARHEGAIAAPESSATPGEAGGGYVFPTRGEQLRAWASNALGPAAIAGNLVGASWRHWVTNEPAEWDEDGRGFAQRFGTGSLTTFIGETTLSLASAAVRQDPAYYRSPRGGLVPRAGHALAMAVVSRDPDGNAVFSPAKALSPFVGPLIVTTTLYPPRYSWKDALLSGAYGLLINAGWNGVREFVLRSPPWRSGRPPVR